MSDTDSTLTMFSAFYCYVGDRIGNDNTRIMTWLDDAESSLDNNVRTLLRLDSESRELSLEVLDGPYRDTLEKEDDEQSQHGDMAGHSLRGSLL